MFAESLFFTILNHKSSSRRIQQLTKETRKKHSLGDEKNIHGWVFITKKRIIKMISDEREGQRGKTTCQQLMNSFIVFPVLLTIIIIESREQKYEDKWERHYRHSFNPFPGIPNVFERPPLVASSTLYLVFNGSRSGSKTFLCRFPTFLYSIIIKLTNAKTSKNKIQTNC